MITKNNVDSKIKPQSEFSIEEVALNLNTSIKNIRKFVASGQLAATKCGGRYVISAVSYKSFCNKFTTIDTETGSCKFSIPVAQFLPGLGIDPEEKLIKKSNYSRTKQPKHTTIEHQYECIDALLPHLDIGFTKISNITKGHSNSDNVNWQDISDVWDAPSHSRMTFVDLFCGAGGLRKGLELSGLEGICGLDWFDEAGQTYSRNFDHPFINGDIKLPENKQRFYDIVRERLCGRCLSLVAGGFPCLGFSMAS